MDFFNEPNHSFDEIMDELNKKYLFSSSEPILNESGEQITSVNLKAGKA